MLQTWNSRASRYWFPFPTDPILVLVDVLLLPVSMMLTTCFIWVQFRSKRPLVTDLFWLVSCPQSSLMVQHGAGLPFLRLPNFLGGTPKPKATTNKTGQPLETWTSKETINRVKRQLNHVSKTRYCQECIKNSHNSATKWFYLEEKKMGRSLEQSPFYSRRYAIAS